MQTVQTEQIVSTRPPPRNLSTQWATPGKAPDAINRDPQFLRLLAGFQRSGGLNHAQDVGVWLDRNRSHRTGSSGTLARWLAHNEVVHFDWRGQTWLPMFQFDIPAMSPHVAVGLVLIEFGGTFHNWAIAQWFACPNSSLDARNPAEVLAADPALVIEAARRETWLSGSPECSAFADH